MKQLRGHSDRICSLAFSPDGGFLASADRSGKVLLWEQSAPAEPRPAFAESEEPRQSVGGLCFMPDGRGLVIARTIQLRSERAWTDVLHWDCERSGSIEPRLSLEGVILKVAADPVGGVLWGVTIGDEHPNDVGLIDCHLSDWDFGHAFLWHNRAEESLRPVTVSGWEVAVLSEDDRNVRVFEVDEDLDEPISWAPHSKPPRGFVPLKDRFIVTAGATDLRLWDYDELREVHRIARIGKPFITSVALSPDATRLAVGRTDGTVNLLDTATWAEVESYRWTLRHVDRLAFAPDGLRLAAGGSNGRIVVWDLG